MFKAHLLEQRNRDVLLIEAFEWDIFGLQNIKIDSWNILLTLVILNEVGTNFVILLFFSPFISEFMLSTYLSSTFDPSGPLSRTLVLTEYN